MSSNYLPASLFKKIHMYKRYVLLIVFAVSLLRVFGNSKIDSIPDPEFINQVYHIDKINQKLIDLEKANSEMKMKMKMLGMGGGSQAYEMDGNHSPVRFGADENSFVLSVGSTSMMSDPSMTLSLYKFEVKKNKREATMMQYSGRGQSNNNNTLELKFKKLKEGVFEVVVPKKLEKGEYGFVNMSMMNAGGKVVVYAFGVD